MAKKSKPNAGPQDGNFERYIEELVKQSPAAQSKTFDQSTVFPEQAQGPSNPFSPIYPASGTNQAGSAGSSGAAGATGAASSAATTAQSAPQDSSAAPASQTPNQQPKVYVFDLKKSILNVLFIWVILGSMCYVIMPPEKHALSFSLVFFLGLICLVLNFQRHNKPLPTRQETINRAGQAVLKRIILFFLKE